MTYNKWNALHIKSGKVYTVIGEAIDCTNSRHGTHMVIYTNDTGMVFVREALEFVEKFQALKNQT